MENNLEQPINQQPLIQKQSSEIPHSGSKWKLILLIIILLVIVGAGAYLLGAKQNVFLSQNQQKIIASPTPLPAKVSTTAGDPTANWQTYNQTDFSFKYPIGWEVAQLPEAANSTLIIAPKDNIDSLRKVNFRVEGGAMGAISIVSSFNVPIPVSDDTKTITSRSVVIGSLYADEYISVYKANLPGIKINDVFINTVVDNAGKKYNIELVDINYRDIYSQVLSTFKFTDLSEVDMLVRNYYNSYFICQIKHNEAGVKGFGFNRTMNEDCPYNMNNALTQDLSSQLGKESAIRGDADRQILCLVQNSLYTPPTFDKVIISNNGTAIAVVHTLWGGPTIYNINVGLRKVNNQWKIASIICNR